MQVSPEQAQFMAWLVQTTGACKALELGVFTGYSALAVALVCPSCMQDSAQPIQVRAVAVQLCAQLARMLRDTTETLIIN